MADLKNEPPKDLVERAIVAMNLPLKSSWKHVVQEAAAKIKCFNLKHYPHGNSRLLLEAIQEAKS